MQFKNCIHENDCYAPAVDDFISLLDSTLECGDDWLTLSTEAIETIIAFAVRCLRSIQSSPRFQQGLKYLSYIIDVIEFTDSKCIAKSSVGSSVNGRIVETVALTY